MSADDFFMEARRLCGAFSVATAADERAFYREVAAWAREITDDNELDRLIELRHAATWTAEDAARVPQPGAPKPKSPPRRKLDAIGKVLAPIARRLAKSSKTFLKEQALFIDFVIGQHPFTGPFDKGKAKVVDAIMETLGFRLPLDMDWGAVAGGCAPSLGTYFADVERAKAAEAAFIRGRDKKAKYKAKKRAAYDAALARMHARNANQRRD